jgi:hypothetical protein
MKKVLIFTLFVFLNLIPFSLFKFNFLELFLYDIQPNLQPGYTSACALSNSYSGFPFSTIHIFSLGCGKSSVYLNILGLLLNLLIAWLLLFIFTKIREKNNASKR